MALFTVTLSDP